MQKRVKPYDLERISARLAKVYGKIYKGEEEGHAIMLSVMEGNMLKIYRKHGNITGENAVRAVRICLMKVDGMLNDTEYDFFNVIDEDDQMLVHALCMSYDPATNDELKDALAEIMDLNDKETMKKYLEEPVKCLARIEKSIEMWTKVNGKTGYFDFISQQIGQMTKGEELKYAVRLPLGYEDFLI